MKLFHLATLALLFSNSNSMGQESPTPILPAPQDAVYFDAAFRIDSLTTIVLGDGATRADSFAAELLIREFEKRAGTRPRLANEPQVSQWRGCVFLGDPDRSSKAQEIAESLTLSTLMDLEDEGYFLQVSDSLVIVLGNSPAGLFYGCQSLIQLASAGSADNTLTGATIYDWPTLQFRGVSIDLSKGDVPNLGALQDLVRFISGYKMNMLMLYLGNVFEYTDYPRIAAGRPVLNREEIRELVQFARQHHVEVVPMVETLCNFEEILSRPEYRDLAEFPGSSTLKPLSEDAYQLLSEIIEEVAAAFDSDYLHLGGSNAPELGWYESRTAVERTGLDAVLAQHYKRVGEIISGLDKQFMMASDILLTAPQILQYMPEDFIIADVTRPQEDDQQSQNDLLVRNGIVSLVLSNGRLVFPDYFALLSRIQAVILHGVDAGAKGAVAAQWSSAANPTLLQPLRFGFAFAAACSWSPHLIGLPEFRQTYFAQQFGRNQQAMRLIYSLLSDMSDRFRWNGLRRHPFVLESSRARKLRSEADRLSVHMKQVLDLLSTLPAPEPVELPQVEYLRFAAQFGSLLAKDVTAALAIMSQGEGLDVPVANGAGRLVEKCLTQLEDLNQVAETVQQLRTGSYKIADQMPDLEAFDIRAAYWQEIMRQVQIGRFGESPILRNDWIQHPALAGSGSQEHAFFRKTFEVARGFKMAYLQAAAQTHVRIYLNGAFVDEVIGGAKNSTVADEPVKMWDVTSAVRPGKNVIAVEAWNYRPGETAAINVYGEIVYELGRTQSVHSNAYWKTSAQSESNWQTLGFFDVQWLNTTIKARAPLLIKPDFQTGRPSQFVLP